ncbi:hypothetical protein SNOUR_41480 [Streptomyces noursei ATCC 11455]|nr:hypothetical protein SNOUR_41480 [Streptomyces noursei ATCC 11455]
MDWTYASTMTAAARGRTCRPAGTAWGQDDHLFDALYAGVSGFLLKDVRRDDLVHAVRVVAAGDSLLAPSATRTLIAAYETGLVVPGRLVN